MSYSLATSYVGSSLISGFNWFNGADLSHGFVAYQSQQDALAKGLYSINAASQAVTLRVDTTNVYPANGTSGGRPSIRLESKLAVNKGLVIGDFAHMPGSICGTWPAFWMYGPNWPNSGELDIIEGASTAVKNLISAHTGQGCTLPSSGFTGSQGSTDCTSPGNNGNIGCNYVPPTSDTHTYGDDFNSVGGGVYAVQWTDEAIKIWHFARSVIPQDITNKTPDPSSWGLPQALFGGSTCDVDKYFKDMSIVIDTDFCGDYAGNLWGVADTCNVDTGSTCREWVGNNPQAFTNAYWEINYIDVYDETSTPSQSSTVPVPTSSRPISSGIYGNSSTTATTSAASSAASSATASSPGTSSPTPTTSLTRNPANIGNFALLGCFGSSSRFVTFSLAATRSDMTPEVCVGLCAQSKYAGVFDQTCYCANDLDAGTSALPDISQCSQNCPGNPNEYCGGLINVSTSPNSGSNSRRLLRTRAAPANVLLTVYGNTGSIQPAPRPAPAKGGPGGSNPTIAGGAGAGVIAAGGAGACAMAVVTSTVTYSNVCATNPAVLEVLEYCTTMTVPGPGCSSNTVTPQVPMATVVRACSACGAGGESAVTLTIPAALCATGTGSGGTPANTGAVVVVPTSQPTAVVNGSGSTSVYVTAAASSNSAYGVVAMLMAGAVGLGAVLLA